MPKVKDRSAFTKSDREKRYELALKGLEDGTYDTLAKAAQAHDLRKSLWYKSNYVGELKALGFGAEGS